MTLDELLDTMSVRYDLGKDKCKKTLTVVDQDGERPAYWYDQGLLTLTRPGDYTAYFSLVDYPEVKSEPFPLIVPSVRTKVRFTKTT